MTIKAESKENNDNDTDNLKHTLFLVNVLSLTLVNLPLKHYSP